MFYKSIASKFLLELNYEMENEIHNLGTTVSQSDMNVFIPTGYTGCRWFRVRLSLP